MVAVRYSLDEFVQDMGSLIASDADQSRIFDRGSALLERLVLNPDAIPQEYRVPSGAGPRPNHGSYMLHRSEGQGFAVSAVIWGPGDHARPHDHHTWGMIGVVGNGITETRFNRVDDRTSTDYARLEKSRETLVKSGEVSLLIPDVDEIHQMDNLSDRPTVEIHVYGRDLTGLNRCGYDLETGKIMPFTTERYDNC